MVIRTNTRVSDENKLSNNELSAAYNEHPELLQSRKSHDSPADDLILSLSDAYENKRARQVFEWERVRRQDVHRAA